MGAPQLVFFEEIEEQAILIKNRERITRKSDKDLSWRDNMDYAYIKTSAELEELLSFLESYDDYIAFDYETTGLDPYNDVIVGVSFAHKENYARYIPIRHTKDFCFSDEKTLQRISNILKTKKMIAHNVVFEYMFTLVEFGIELNGCLDTQAMVFVADSNDSSGLKKSCKRYFNQDMEDFKEVTGGAYNFQDLRLEDCYKYACCDSDITYRLFKLFQSRGFLDSTRGTEGFIVQIENTLAPVVAELTLNGIGINIEETEKFITSFDSKITEIKNKIWEAIKAVPDSINLDSPAQIGKLFYEDLGLTVQDRTESGQAAVNADALENLKGVHPVVDMYLEYKSLVKVREYYVSYIEKYNKKTNKIHAGWNAQEKGSGRFCCRKPNLQNVAEPIREVFKPAPGHYFAGIDYSAIEARLLVSEAGAVDLVEGYNNGADMHKVTASMIYNVAIENVTSKQRKNAKTFTYGMAYGMSPGSMAESLGCSKQEAQTIYNNFFKQSPKIKEYMDSVKRFAHENGYSVTPYGRRKYLPKINSTDDYEMSSSERLAVNSAIQGHAADIMKLAMIRVRNRLRKLNGDKFDPKNDKVKMVLTIHDELVFEISEELDRDLVLNTILDGMVFDLKLNDKYTKMSCDIAIGQDWKNLKDMVKDENGHWEFKKEETKPESKDVKIVFTKNEFTTKEKEVIKVLLNANEKTELYCNYNDKLLKLGNIKNDPSIISLIEKELNVKVEERDA